MTTFSVRLILVQLTEELEKRSIALPEKLAGSFSSQDEIWHENVSRLNLAVIEDIKKGPVKYDFGSAWFNPDDLTSMPRGSFLVFHGHDGWHVRVPAVGGQFTEV